MVRGVAPGEAALDAGVALVGAAVLVRHHPHDLVAAQLGLERAADAAVGAGGQHRAGGHARARRRCFSCSAVVGQACTQAPHETHSELMNGLAGAGRHLRVEAAALDGQRERALDLVAGAHAARADDARGRVEGEVGVGVVDRGVQVVVPVRAVADLAQPDRRRPWPAARSRRRPARSGSRPGGRRGRAPRRRGAASSSRGVWVATACPARPGWCTRRACPCARRSRPGTAGTSRTARGESVAHSLGTSTPASAAARMTEVPGGHRDRAAVDLDLDGLPGPAVPGCRSRAPGAASWRARLHGVSYEVLGTMLMLPSPEVLGEVLAARCAPASASARPWRTASRRS